MENSREVILELRGLRKWFPVSGSRGKKFVKAVNDVDLTLRRGETLGIVGESGCGKSTLARLTLRLLDATGGAVLYRGKNLMELSREELRETRRHLQMIFQDPYASLNPRQTIGSILCEPFLIHKICGAKEAAERAKGLLRMVELPEESMKKFPHEFSGGQRQRICIARAMAVMPEIIICDECVSALDVSIQAQIINMLRRLQREYGLTLIFISHDLRVVRHISDRVAVMYLGEVVECAEKETLYKSPAHPYSRALLSAVPVADPTLPPQRIRLNGEIPSPIDRPSGCAFRTRCAAADGRCAAEAPAAALVGENHVCRCFHAGKTPPGAGGNQEN